MIKRAHEYADLWREVNTDPELTFNKLAFLCGFGFDSSITRKDLAIRMNCSEDQADHYLHKLKELEMVRNAERKWHLTKKGLNTIEKFAPHTYA